MLIHSFVITISSGESFARDIFGFPIPRPPIWVSYIPYLGFFIGVAFEFVSIHGLVGIAVSGILFVIGSFLVGLTLKEETVDEPSIPDDLPDVIKQELTGKSEASQSSLFSDVGLDTPSNENNNTLADPYESEKTNFICTLVGNLVAARLKGDINDLDLYNSIIRLISNTDFGVKEDLKPIVGWLDEHDSPEEMGEALKNIEKVESAVGKDYVEGIMRLAYAYSPDLQKETELPLTQKSEEENVKTTEKEPIIFLGEKLDPEHYPILYKKAKNHPASLKRDLLGLAKVWHEGNIRATMNALEVDLEHG